MLGHEYPELDLSAVRIVLIEALGQVLPLFSETLGGDTEAELEQRGIEVRLSTRVVDASDETVQLSSGERIETKTLVWAAGVKPAALAAAVDVSRAWRPTE